MTLNFRATGVQADKIIASGSSGTSTGAKLVIYPINADELGTPNQGYIDQTVFATGSVGTDIFLFVSGGIGERGTTGAQSITTFGGDVHISGNLSIDGTGGGGGGNSYWISDSSNIIYTTGSANITGSISISGSVLAISGLSGSHTALADGTRYLVAGTNITINTASNGSVEISGSSFIPSLMMCAGFDDFTDPAFPGWDVYCRGDKVLSGSGNAGQLMQFTNLAMFSSLSGSGIAIMNIPSASLGEASASIAMCRLGEGLALDEIVPVVTEWRFAPLTASLPTFTICDTQTMWAFGLVDLGYQSLSDQPANNTIAMLATIVTGTQIYKLVHFSGSASGSASAEFLLPPAIASYRMRLSVLSGSSTLEIGADDGAYTVSRSLSGAYAPSASLYTPWAYHGQGGAANTGYDRFLAIDYVGWSGKRAAVHSGPVSFAVFSRGYSNSIPWHTRDRRIEFTDAGVGATESISRHDQMIRVDFGPIATSGSLTLPDPSNCNTFVIKKTNSSTGSLYLKPSNRQESIDGITGSNYLLTGSNSTAMPAWTVWSDKNSWWVA